MFSLFTNSDRATTSGPITWRTLVGIITVPVLVAGLLTWAFWSPEDNHATARAAVVNNDEPVTVNGQIVPLGRQLAGNLVHSKDSGYDWVLTDSADAGSGLSGGRYSAVVTIPKTFSKQATSTGGKPLEAEQATLRVETSKSGGLVDPVASKQIANATLGALNQQVVQTYLDNIYLGFTTVHGQLGKAADGASQLSEGTGQLVVGLGKLSSGAGELASGTGKLTEGSGQLSAGLTSAEQQTAQLPALTKQLADGAAQVAAGNRQLADKIVPIADQVIAVIDALPSATQAAQRFRDLADRCADQGGDPRFCAQLSAAADRFSAEAAVIDGKRAEIRDAAVLTKKSVSDLASGAGQVAQGNAALAAKAAELAGGIATAADGARQLDSGIRQADSGARQLAEAAEQAANGAGKLDSGSKELASGLNAGRDQVPNYSERDRQHLKQVAASPLRSEVDGGGLSGPGAAVFFLVLALWTGALATYVVIRAVPPSVLTSRRPTWRIIVGSALPGTGIAALTALLLSLVLAPAFGLGLAAWLAVLGVTLLAAFAFTAVNRALVAIFRQPGRFVAIAVLVLAAATGIVSTVPGFFQSVAPFLPTHGAVVALRAIVTGADGLVPGIAELLAWLAAGVIATIVVTERRRVVPDAWLRGRRALAA
ncbi:YhgE/Pip family protein [Kutzneria albida]|uniref:YhgE/Pip N-terminal domain-containing protein n=1 Tax=Kutzneria albida DSM 43870 TaxID=1449976 RepID=W5W3C6_9PSEU|nr:YhgE/Pip family protein [Kutzneria albida]AHH95693.1 YhgE/Pip N-terminal domain-containing protein [Kutzneria albida DSM 43870]